MRLVDNPPNPYVSRRDEWLGPLPPAHLEVIEEQARSIITRNDSPDVGARWTVNPYRGCGHACTYCYARRTHEYLGWGAGTDFETRLTVKINAPYLIRKELAAPSWRKERVAFSGVTDCYQPIETRYRLTRRCLEACLEVGNPVCVVTKSYLVVRDSGLLAELAGTCGANVCISIPFTDLRSGCALEPGAPPPAQRFEAIRNLSAAGVPVGVLVAPVIPGLTDWQIPEILRRAAEAGARFAGHQALRLPGNVAGVFLKRLREAMPAAATRIESRLRGIRGGRLNDPRFGERMRGRGPYWESVEQLFEAACRRYGLKGPPCNLGGSCEAPGRVGANRRGVQLRFGFGED